MRLNGISIHVMYVRALCYKNIGDYREALISYAKVMKTESEIQDYEKMLDRENFKQLDLKAVEGPGCKGWHIDMYSHFKRQNLLKP